MQWTSDPIRHLRTTLFATLVASSSLTHADLFFSEYIEGSSNNKALEIYNNTGASVDLSAYEVQMFFNGNTNAALTIALQGTLPDGEVYVLSHSAAHPDILAVADQTNGAGWFNGDDAVALLYGGNPIDVIGQIGVDPGSQWGTGDTATANKTLRRMTSVTEGDADGYDTFDPAQQ
ncbi:MAG TPA: lamin tail domain-containing protein [Cellvibrio sp.]|nr:lamin tail domain-containing protein [Cellvibrio sp.]